jgi:prepilin-type N-terminal cleavage/methylation domain-containing protein
MFIKNRYISLIGRGFTLIEVLISITIVTIIMSVILFNYSMFTENLALSSAGQEIAIAVRQAQTYGLTVKEVATGGGRFDSAYGVYFNPTTDPTNYYVFVDKDGDGLYDHGSGCGSGNTECIELSVLRNRITIESICDQTACPPTANSQGISVTFLRPNPDARIRFTNSSGVVVAGPSLTGKVNVRSPGGDTVTLTIESTGQVLVQ